MSITSVSSTEARQNWAEILNRAAYSRERFAVERHGEPVAAIVSADDLDVIQTVSDRAAVSEALDVLEAPDNVPEASSDAHPLSSESDVTLEEAIGAIVTVIRRRKESPRKLMNTAFRKIASELGHALSSQPFSETSTAESASHDTLF